MAFINSRKHSTTHRKSASSSGMVTAATLLTGLALAFPATATDTPAPASSSDAQIAHAKNLPGVKVEATTNDYRVDQLSSPKFTQPLLDTPQTISVINKELIQQQGATTLTEALRNTPGVGTFFLGENGNTSTGDAIYMRGFDTSSSIFVDGVRDLGSISRDVFNIEQVEVVKGPAGTDIGRTAPTGYDQPGQQAAEPARQPTRRSVACGSGDQQARHRRLQPDARQRPAALPPER